LPETGAIALTNMIKSSVKLPVRVSGAMALSKLAGFSLAAAAAEKERAVERRYTPTAKRVEQRTGAAVKSLRKP
jgi:hypothetical protein